MSDILFQTNVQSAIDAIRLYKEKTELIDIILNDLSIDMIIALYEVIVNEDFDYIENLFPTKEDFKEFIEKYKGDKND